MHPIPQALTLSRLTPIRRVASSSEAILELLAIPIGLPGPLDSIREAQQHCASEQRQADEADDVNKSGMATRRAVGTFIRHYFLPPENLRDRSRERVAFATAHPHTPRGGERVDACWQRLNPTWRNSAKVTALRPTL